MDGMLYISVSKNQADGMGTFWEPHFSKTSMTIFREQPPLYFGLLSAFYKFFGSSMYVERLFCFICFVLTLVYIHKIWKSFFRNDPNASQHSWLPILFFTTIPVCFWSYANHVEETVMALFATMSIFYLSKALFERERMVFYIFLAGVCAFLSSLTKGVQGLFPITGVFFYWLLKKDFSFKQNIIYSTVLVGTPAIIYILLIVINPHIYDVFRLYFENRLGIAFYGTEHNTTTNRFEIVIRLITELIPMFGLMLIAFLVDKKINKEKTNRPKHTIEIIWLVLIGLSGSLPLMVTLEQRGFYLLTALPLFALAGAIGVVRPIANLIQKINSENIGFKYFKRITLFLVVFSIFYTLLSFGKTKRNKEMLKDVYAFGEIIPRGEIVGIPIQMQHEWHFKTYMVRYNYISLDESGTLNKYFAIKKDLPKELVPPEYEPYPIKTEDLDLYILKKK